MSEQPMGPGWWQASDAKFYPPETHPNYRSQPPGQPSFPAPPAQPPGAGPTPYRSGPYQSTPYQPAPAAEMSISEGLDKVRTAAKRLSATAWTLYLGLFVGVIAVFLTWQTGTDAVLGIDEETALGGVGKFAVILLSAGAAWCAVPAITGSRMVLWRLIGLSAAVGLLVVLAIVGLSGYSGVQDFTDATPSLGLLLYTAAVIASTVGVVRIWLLRPKAAGTPRPQAPPAAYGH
ncbi:hypothetical protein FOS14_03025 [Skermania sp. ID1734]|uniref:hypothetical protein n=1 Tax=Skermania sp. ID1734 TaxID=2597516 RepID=UPI00117F95D5|nr:hypothetical protein [Skermania sp. ID1734]TSE01528.1 hypothetical protein FOS14_03025 [Skermania sp. ID1734]